VSSIHSGEWLPNSLISNILVVTVVVLTIAHTHDTIRGPAAGGGGQKFIYNYLGRGTRNKIFTKIRAYAERI